MRKMDLKLYAKTAELALPCLALPSLPDFYDRADFISQASSFLLLLTTWGFLSCQDDEDIKSDKSFASLCLCGLAALPTYVRGFAFHLMNQSQI